MNIFSLILDDLKSVRSGMKKAKRDYVKIQAFHVEHHNRHQADPNYQCGDFINDFWANLGKDVNPHIDVIEAAGYTHMKNRLVRTESDGKPEITFSSVLLEMDGNETPEQMIEKVKQAILDKDAFAEVVSETPEQKKNNKKKEGK